jgi:hypothetical protein
MTPTDRARQARADIERAFRRSNPSLVVLDEIEDIIRKTLAEHEKAVRHEYE